MVDLRRGRPTAERAAVQLRAGLYGRESHDKTKSVDDQLSEGREAIEDRDWILVDSYKDGVSASRFGTKIRKGWNRLLTDLDADLLDVIVTWEPSRADRDLETWVRFVAKCRDKGVLVLIVGDDEVLDPRILSHWKRLIDGGVDAAMESEKTSKRVRRGVSTAAEAGEFHGDTPYGFERVITGERETKHGPKPVKMQRMHPEHGPIVQKIFERLSLNDPIKTIVDDLNARGVVAPAGERWHRNTIRKMAFNVAYIGQRDHHGDIYNGKWDGLVSEETFYAVRDLLRDPKRKTSQPGRMKWLLTYLGVTPCGAMLHYMGPNRGRPAKYHCVRDGCVSVGHAEADEVIARLVVKRASRKDVRDLFTDDEEPAKRARSEAAALRAKLQEATDSFLQPEGGISAKRLAAIEQDLEPKIADADKRAVSQKAPMALLALLSAAEFGAEKVRPAWEGLPVPAQREILRLLFDEILVGKPTVALTRWSTPVERVASAISRISVTWRKPGSPGRDDEAKPPRQRGAKAQRRRETRIQLVESDTAAGSVAQPA